MSRNIYITLRLLFRNRQPETASSGVPSSKRKLQCNINIALHFIFQPTASRGAACGFQRENWNFNAILILRCSFETSFANPEPAEFRSTSQKWKRTVQVGQSLWLCLVDIRVRPKANTVTHKQTLHTTKASTPASGQSLTT